MGLFDQFPYTNFHELNLDWILQALKELEHTIDQFVAINALKYADPIQWDITSQYEKNTIVIDPQTGTAYISVQPVPIGVSLTNPDYWTVVFDLGSFVVRAAKNLANTYEAETTLTATVSTPAGGWLVWGDTLYKALVNITAGDSYVEGGNIAHFTIEDVVGHLEDLNTTDKSNLVAAINDILAILSNTTGDLADLNTTDKSNLVAAINEVLTTLINTSGDLADLTTTDKSNLVAAINEVLTTLSNTAGDLADLTTTDKSNLVAAINEVNSTGGGAIGMIGDLDDLNTTDKSNVVAAINEVISNIPKFKYVVTDYGILPDNGDVYSELYDFLHNVVDPNGGGIVYFPAGTYTLSYTILIPSNTIFMGCGPATKIVFNEADTWVGVALANGGSNIKICNMTVNTLTTSPLDFLGANVGSIGVGSMSFAAEKHSRDIPQQNNKNIVIENIWCDTSYVVQTEPDVNHEVANVIYRNIYCPNGCVSVGLDTSYDCAISMENIYCDTLRCGMGGGSGDVVAKNINCKYAHIGVWRFVCDSLTIRKSTAPNATNIHTCALYIEKGNVSLDTTISITNAFIYNGLSAGGEHGCIIGTDIGKAVFTNCIFYANDRAYYIAGGSPKPLFINCFLYGTSASTVYGTAIGCTYSPAPTNGIKTLDADGIAHTLGSYNGNAIPCYSKTGTLLGYIPLYS